MKKNNQSREYYYTLSRRNIIDSKLWNLKQLPSIWIIVALCLFFYISGSLLYQQNHIGKSNLLYESFFENKLNNGNLINEIQWLNELPMFDPVVCKLVDDTILCGQDGKSGFRAEESPKEGWFYEESPYDEVYSAVYSWVNGSDEGFIKASKLYYSKNNPIASDILSEKSKLFPRDGVPLNRIRYLGELRYSIRSIYEYGRSFINNIVIASHDYPNHDYKKGTGYIMDSGVDENGVSFSRHHPTFLNSTVLMKSNSKASSHHLRKLDGSDPLSVSVVYSSEYFEDVRALPTFNSMAIESQMSKIKHIFPNGILIYVNDDMFMTKKHDKTFFYSKKYGMNLYFQSEWKMPPLLNRPKATDFSSGDLNSNHAAGLFTNYILGTKFGSRVRGVQAHTYLAFPVSLLNEVDVIFHDEMISTSFNRARSNGLNVQAGMLTFNYILEMNRLTLLNGIIELLIDFNQDGQISLGEVKEFLSSLFIDTKPKFNEMGVNNYQPGDKAYNVKFMSRMGIARTFINLDSFTTLKNKPWFNKNIWNFYNKAVYFEPSTPISQRQCRLISKECLDFDYTSTSSLLNKWVKTNPECGDCIITAISKTYKENGTNPSLVHILKRSKPLFNVNKISCKDNELPEEYKYLDSSACIDEEHENNLLPNGYGLEEYIALRAEENLLSESKIDLFISNNKISKNNKDIDKKFYHLMGVKKIQRFLHLAARYRHTVSDIKHKFHMVFDKSKETFKKLSNIIEHRPNSLCLNDDIKNDEDREEIMTFYRSFFPELFGNDDPFYGEITDGLPNKKPLDNLIKNASYNNAIRKAIDSIFGL